MSKYIKLEGLKWHSPDESLVKPLTEFYITESDIADLPTIEVSEDCISRADLLKTIDDNVSQQYRDTYETYGLDLWGLFVRIVKNAPSVIPTQNNAIQRVECVEKPREGEWIEILNDRHRMLKVLKCSNCEEKNHFFVEDKRDFCPNCGSKMKGADDE